MKILDRVENTLRNGGAPGDADGDGFPEGPAFSHGSLPVGSSTGCEESTYTECFYARKLLQIDKSMTISDKQFADLIVAAIIDIRGRTRTPLDRSRYDTPFWDAYGVAPGQVCISGHCYSRAEVNYLGQGIWSAADNQSLAFGENVVVGGWKLINHAINSKIYPSPTPSAGDLFWFEIGYLAYGQLNQ